MIDLMAEATRFQSIALIDTPFALPILRLDLDDCRANGFPIFSRQG